MATKCVDCAGITVCAKANTISANTCKEFVLGKIDKTEALKSALKIAIAEAKTPAEKNAFAQCLSIVTEFS